MLAANPAGHSALVHPQAFRCLDLGTEVADQIGEGCFHGPITLYGNTHNNNHGNAHLQEYGRAHDNQRMEFKDRLKQARKRLKMSQTSLAEAVGLDQTSISDLERGKSQTTGYTAQIAHVLGVSSRWLATGMGEMLETVSERGDEIVFQEMELIEGHEPLRADEVMLPIFREVEFAAGNGCTQVIENHGAQERFSLHRLSKRGVQPENAALAVAKGDSMATTILNDATIAIDKGAQGIVDGKIYALDHGGMLRVKRLYRLPMNRMRVVSDNHIEFPEEVYSMADPDAPRIIGRVFWWENFD